MEHIIDKNGNVIFSTSNNLGHFSEGLCPIRNSECKYGYINRAGELAIPYQFENVEDFKGGVACVKNNGKWGLINYKGKLICPYYHDSADEVPTIHDGIICKYDHNKNNHYQYIDINGNMAIDTSAYYIIDDNFCDGYARVWNTANECALINTKGNIVIPFGKYSHIREIHCGVAQVQRYIGKKTQYGYVNASGIEVVPFGKYDEFWLNLSDLDLPVVCAVKNGKCGYIDIRTGKELIPCEYVPLGSSKTSGISRWTGFRRDVNENPTFVINLKKIFCTSENTIFFYNSNTFKLFRIDTLDNAGSYSEGLCAVKKNGKIGFIDDHCKLIIPYKFEDQSNNGCNCHFYEGVCALFYNMLIDRNGNEIKRFPQGYSRLHYLGDGLYSADVNKAFVRNALVNLKGEIIWEGFRFADFFHETPIAVQNESCGRWKFINKEGRLAFSQTFNKEYRFEDGYAVIGETMTIKTGKSTTQTNTTRTQPQKTYSSNSGCYIATAVYGSYNCPEVWTLRRYRDNVLDNSWYGRLFIQTYYAISPTLVKWFGNEDWFKNLFLNPLNKWVAKLNKQGFENTPYIDKY